jgi:hypothetical protein
MREEDCTYLCTQLDTNRSRRAHNLLVSLSILPDTNRSQSFRCTWDLASLESIHNLQPCLGNGRGHCMCRRCMASRNHLHTDRSRRASSLHLIAPDTKLPCQWTSFRCTWDLASLESSHNLQPCLGNGRGHCMCRRCMASRNHLRTDRSRRASSLHLIAPDTKSPCQWPSFRCTWDLASLESSHNLQPCLGNGRGHCMCRRCMASRNHLHTDRSRRASSLHLIAPDTKSPCQWPSFRCTWDLASLESIHNLQPCLGNGRGHCMCRRCMASRNHLHTDRSRRASSLHLIAPDTKSPCQWPSFRCTWDLASLESSHNLQPCLGNGRGHCMCRRCMASRNHLHTDRSRRTSSLHLIAPDTKSPCQWPSFRCTWDLASLESSHNLQPCLGNGRGHCMCRRCMASRNHLHTDRSRRASSLHLIAPDTKSPCQ